MCSVCTRPSMNPVKNVQPGENRARPKIRRGGNDASSLNGHTSQPPERSFRTTRPRGLQVPHSQSAKQTGKSKRIGR